MAAVESYAPVMAKAPTVFNFFLKQPWAASFSKTHIGMVDLPLLSSPTLKQQLSGHPAMQMTLEQLEGLTEAQRAKTVLVVQDPFTSFYEARLVSDFIRLIEKLGYQPVLLPFSPNGKAQHVKGFLQRFARTASKTADFLNRVARLGMPMVGIDPATVLCYRDEYRQTLGRRGAISMCCWCMNGCRMRCRNVTSRLPAAKPGICLRTAPKSPPCLQHPVSGRRFFYVLVQSWKTSTWAAVAWRALTDTRAKSGQFAGHICALMASAVAKLPRQRCLATGFFCRSQVKRVEGNGMRHPLQALLELV